MAFKIEERFEVQAPVDRVWKYLIDPARVVHCLPGAELTEQHFERLSVVALGSQDPTAFLDWTCARIPLG